MIEWSETARRALTQYHLVNLGAARTIADSAPPDDRTATLVGALASWESLDLLAIVNRTAAALMRPPRDTIDFRLRLLAQYAAGLMQRDPSTLLQEIDEALAGDDPWLQGAAWEHRLDTITVSGNWSEKLPFKKDWLTARELGTQAAAAYERAGDRASALRVLTRLARIALDAADVRKLVKHLSGIGAEALEGEAKDSVIFARSAMAVAVLHVRHWIATGAKGEPPQSAVDGAIAFAREVSAPAYEAEVHAALGPVEVNRYFRAFELFTSCGQWSRAFDAMFAFGEETMSRRQYADAMRAFASARDVADAIQLPLARICARSQLGMCALESQDAPRAIHALTEAVELAQGFETTQVAHALRALARAWLSTHQREGFVKAIAYLQRAAAIHHAVGDPRSEMEALSELTQVYTRLAATYIRERKQIPKEIADGARANIERFRKIAAVSPEHASLLTTLRMAEAQTEHRYGTREEMFRRLDEAFAAAPTESERASVRYLDATFSMEHGRDSRDVELLRRSARHFEELYRARTGGDAAQDSARVHALLAKFESDPEARKAAADLARTRIDEAVRHYEGSNRFLRVGAPAASMNAQFGRHVTSSLAYELAVQVHMIDGNAAAAFESLERNKSAVLASALASTSIRPPAGIDPEMLRAEATLLDVSTRGTAELRTDAHAQLDALWDRMKEVPGGDAYVSLRRGETISWQDATRLLDEAARDLADGRRLVIVEYFVLAGEEPLAGPPLHAFILRSGDPQPLVVPIDLPLASINDTAERIHVHPKKNYRHNVLERLAPLVAPIAEHVAPGDVVCVIPSERLYFLPLHAIPVPDGQPLIARNPVFYAPSATALRAAIRERRPPHAAHSAAVFGNPSEDLAAAEAEAVDIARELGVTPLLRDDATAPAFVDALRRHDVVHFAGHAQFDLASPLASALQFAGESTITAAELLRLGDVRAEMVVLSGCQTGLALTSSGDEIVGLTRAFLYCGVTCLVQTLWRVADKTTATLMVELYRNWLKHSMPRVDALRAATLELRSSSQHPFFWAPFTLYGDWR